MQARSPGWKREFPPRGGNGKPLQSSCLQNPMDRGAWRSTVHGVAESRTRLSDTAHRSLKWGHGSGPWSRKTSERRNFGYKHNLHVALWGSEFTWKLEFCGPKPGDTPRTQPSLGSSEGAWLCRTLISDFLLQNYKKTGLLLSHSVVGLCCSSTSKPIQLGWVTWDSIQVSRIGAVEACFLLMKTLMILTEGQPSTQTCNGPASCYAKASWFPEPHVFCWPSAGGLSKEPTCQCRRCKEAWIWILGQEDPPGVGYGNPLQYSWLENSSGRGAWWATVHSLAESDMTEAT